MAEGEAEAMAAGPAPAPADPDVEPLPRGFRCRLCQVSAANRPSLAEHLRGKKHQRLRTLRAERRAQEQRSLFVSGFARGTSGAELAEYFGAFGDVATVVMDKEKGVYAIVELREAAGRERALAEPQHALAGHRLRVRPREEKVFAYSPRPGGGARREPLGPEKLEQALCQAPDVDAQMSQLVELLELSEAERRVRHLLVTLFQEVFTEFFPGESFPRAAHGRFPRAAPWCPSVPPSTASTPAAATLTFSWISNPPNPSRPQPRTLPLPPRTLKIPPERHRFGGHAGQRSSWTWWPPSCAAACPACAASAPSPSARRPVVKFTHKQSALARSDVSIDNRLALLNTRFLRLCADADARVRPLVYAVRLWAKQQGLAGNPLGGGPLLNNYALTLLVLFFLQTRSPPVLPTVARLRDLAGPEDRAVVAGWDCTFPRDAAALAPSANTETPSSLLAEFFRVFSDFDFAGQLVSLREGRASPLPPPENPEGLKLGPLNLQDPFELDHNVAANVNAKTAARLARCCRRAAKFCRSLRYRRKSAKGRAWGLTRLFQPAAAQPGAAAAAAFLIPIPTGDARRPRALRFRQVCAAVAFVLGDVLGCSCAAGTPVWGDSEVFVAGGKRRFAEETDGAAAKKPRRDAGEEESAAEGATWTCAVWHRVWTGRRRLRRRLLRGDGPRDLALERTVSQTIVHRDGAERPPQPLLRFAASARPAATHVLLRLLPSPDAPAPLFRDFYHFLKSFLPAAVRRRLGEGAARETQPQDGEGGSTP
ncbi:speckle targeted PIP5K1A-regulated poly(A) polymerase-like [Strix uralensis]|uniref:speckle targeted PIP5K1A-regulated poly(A) polymerase-like n=1 Tax=Strix uralensis TaxID=36305 RepID=UPI003DA5BB57